MHKAPKAWRAMEGKRAVLVVDDELASREVMRDMLESLGYLVVMAQDGLEALAKLAAGVDLVLLDVNMPRMDGFEVVKHIRKRYSAAELPVIMVTGVSGRDERLRAVQAGANDFIEKPVDMTELRVRVSAQLRLKEAQDALRRYQTELENLVEERTAALRLALDELAEANRSTHRAYLDTIFRLALAAEYKDRETAGHIRRVGRYCGLIGRALGLPLREAEVLEVAGPMHDVGKLGVPDHILLKPGKLDAGEWEAMKQHTLIGARLLEGSPSEYLQAGAVIALSHHERWDGSGYPRGLVGEEIPLPGRICAVADVFDALTTDRPYRKAMSNEEALEVMRSGRGGHFDPEILDLFFENLDEVLAIQGEVREAQPAGETDAD